MIELDTIRNTIISLSRSKAGSDTFSTLKKQFPDMSDAELMKICAEVLKVSYLPGEALRALSPRFEVVNFTLAMAKKAVVAEKNKQRYFILANPFDNSLRTWLFELTDGQAIFAVATESDLKDTLGYWENSLKALDVVGGASISSENLNNEEIINLSLKEIAEESSSIIKLVNTSLFDALEGGVSDIHIESTARGATIKYRLDGVLSVASSVQEPATAEQVISRLKIMSSLDISERRVPQDGRFKVFFKGREVNIRVSIMPCIFGEDAVLRVLDRQALTDDSQELSLTALGYEGESLSVIRKVSKEPYGMVLITGPTGSGKTTTLYAILSEINTGRDKIITIEDPVEYQIHGVTQIPVNEKKGLTFAKGLRSILRHDPDKILVGEIRDPETAHIAVQSALTGHLVLTSVHANNVFDVFGRFINMDIDLYSIATALNGVIAQRLYRVVCPHCAVPYTPEASELSASGISPDLISKGSFVKSKGCFECRGTGFKGRKAISEMMIMSDEIRQLIVDKAPVSAIKQIALSNGTKLLRQAAVEKVLEGVTTLEEIDRVTFI